MRGRVEVGREKNKNLLHSGRRVSMDTANDSGDGYSSGSVQSNVSGMTEEFADGRSISDDSLQPAATHDVGSGQKHRVGNNRMVVKVSDLIEMITLKFRDQQLEADYQVHRKKNIR